MRWLAPTPTPSSARFPGLDPHLHWSVRAALATTLGDLGRERAQTPLTGHAERRRSACHSRRCWPALAKVGATNAAAELTARLKSDDPVVRAAAARGLATLEGGPTPRRRCLEAYHTRAERRPVCGAHGGARRARGARPRPQGARCSTTALTDCYWAVRVRAAEHLKRLDAKCRRRGDASRAGARIARAGRASTL